jgi:hypothetical protein
VDSRPGRQIVGRAAPLYPRLNNLAKVVEDLPKVVHSLTRVLGQQSQVRCDEGPFIVADITQVWPSCLRANSLPNLRMPVTNGLLGAVS